MAAFADDDAPEIEVFVLTSGRQVVEESCHLFGGRIEDELAADHAIPARPRSEGGFHDVVKNVLMKCSFHAVRRVQHACLAGLRRSATERPLHRCKLQAAFNHNERAARGV